MDVGVYTIHFCQMVLQQEPKSIKATGIVNDDGVDVEVNAEFTYSGNKTATIRISAINTYENAAKIHGTKGTLTVHNKLLDIYFIDIISSLIPCASLGTVFYHSKLSYWTGWKRDSV